MLDCNKRGPQHLGEIPVYTPEGDWVEVSTLCTAACATDKNREWQQPPDGEDKLCNGHESVVLHNGQPHMLIVRTTLPGAPEYVARAPHMFALKPDGFVVEMGLYKRHGAFQHRLRVLPQWLIPVPAGVKAVHAPFIETLSTIEKGRRLAMMHWASNLCEFAEIERDAFPSHIAVVGVGKAAQIASAYFKAMGYTVIVLGRDEPGSSRAQTVHSFGCDYVQLPVGANKVVDFDKLPALADKLQRKYDPGVRMLFDTTAEQRLRIGLRGLLMFGGVDVGYGIPECACEHTMDINKPAVQEVLQSITCQGSVNAAKRDWDRAGQLFPKVVALAPKLFNEGLDILDGLDVQGMHESLAANRKPVLCPNGIPKH